MSQLTRSQIGQVVAVIGLVMFVAGWTISSDRNRGGRNNTPEAMYGGVVVFLVGVTIWAKDAESGR